MDHGGNSAKDLSTREYSSPITEQVHRSGVHFAPQQILYWSRLANPLLQDQLDATFKVVSTSSALETFRQAKKGEFKVVVIDFSGIPPDKLKLPAVHDKDSTVFAGLPVVVIAPPTNLDQKLRAFEAGCDDYLDSTTPAEEIVARIKNIILHRIANEQLKALLESASQTAYSAMTDNSDLGGNIQFLLDANNSNNLDELGVLFFASVRRYKLSISLQMRSAYGIKNMDANGLARDLESKLLYEMRNEGRYVDFDRRTIMNYGFCSVVVRNMPVDDEKRYGAIKDNVFYMLQGLDARIISLDQNNKLLEEKVALARLSNEVKKVMTEIDFSYQKVMRDIASSVESMAEVIQDRIPILLLSEEQEEFFETVTSKCVNDTNRIFGEGLKVDETFKQLSKSMDKAMRSLEASNTDLIARKAAQTIPAVADDDDGVELF